MTIAFKDFEAVEMRVGTITDVEEFRRARNPSYKLTIDFGDGDVRPSSAQVTNHPVDDLVGMQVICVTNFEPRNIAGFMSEVLVLGVPGEDGEISLLTPSRRAELGGRVS